MKGFLEKVMKEGEKDNEIELASELFLRFRDVALVNVMLTSRV